MWGSVDIFSIWSGWTLPSLRYVMRTPSRLAVGLVHNANGGSCLQLHAHPKMESATKRGRDWDGDGDQGWCFNMLVPSHHIPILTPFPAWSVCCTGFLLESVHREEHHMARVVGSVLFTDLCVLENPEALHADSILHGQHWSPTPLSVGYLDTSSLGRVWLRYHKTGCRSSTRWCALSKAFPPASCPARLGSLKTYQK